MTEKDRKKIERNILEDKEFIKVVDKCVKNNFQINVSIKIGTTPFCLRVAGADVMPLVVSPSDLRNCVADQQLSNNNKRSHTENHNISLETVKEFPKALRNPMCICVGNRPNSLLLISDLLDKKGQNIVFPIYLSVKGQKSNINKIVTIYGKKNIQDFILRMYSENKILAVNKEKIDKCFVNQSNANIGLQLSKFENIINLDNSIAYSLENVKYPDEKNFEKSGDDKSMTEQEMMAQVEAKLRSEFEAKFQSMEQKFASLEEQVQTINKFMAAMTEAQDLDRTLSEIESVTKQLTNCEKATFYCYDNTENKFFTQGGDYREWQDTQSYTSLQEAFNSKECITEENKSIVPIVSTDGSALGVIAAEKENGLSEKDRELFQPNSQIVSTIELALKKEFEHQGRITDELTGLKNRQGLNEYAVNTICGRINSDKPVNIVMCDIDHFKSVNDTYGHDAGDIVLKDVAKILQDGTRSGSDCAFRFGGEEMILILNCEPEEAYEIAERLRTEVESSRHTVTVDGQEKNINVTISMGLYQMSPETEMIPENARAVFDSEFKNADELVYAAKESGRNKVSASPEILQSYISMKAAEIICGERNDAALTMKEDIKEYMSNNEFDVVIEALEEKIDEMPQIAEEAERIIGLLEQNNNGEQGKDVGEVLNAAKNSSSMDEIDSNVSDNIDYQNLVE